MRFLIGVDDTDNAKSPGTPSLVRRLAEWMQVDGLADPLGVTRHQLLRHRRIHYTSRNSSVCLSIETENVEGVWETVRDFLTLECASGSNAGLCLSRWDSVPPDVIALGQRAKTEILQLDEAESAASKADLQWAGLTGNGKGLIGALAAVGLHCAGNDGRFIWLRGLQALQGKYSIAEIFEKTRIDRVCSLEGAEPASETMVEVGDWSQPVLRNGQATLYVEEKRHMWSALEKERIKKLCD